MKLAEELMKYGRLKTELEKTKKVLDEAVKSKGGFLDLGIGGGVLRKASRESLDKKKVKDLLGEIQYKEVSKITEYEMIQIFTDQAKWKKYKLVFTKGGK